MGLVFPEGIEIVQDYFIEVIKHAVFKQLSAFLNFQLLGKKPPGQPEDQKKTHMTIAIHDKMNEIFKGTQDYESLKDYEKESFEKNSSDKCSICNDPFDPSKRTYSQSAKNVYKRTIHDQYQNQPDFNDYVCKHKICTNCFLPGTFNLQITRVSKIVKGNRSTDNCLTIVNSTNPDDKHTKIITKVKDNPIFTIYNCCPICNSAKNPETPIPNILINNNYKPAAVTASNQFMKDIFDKKYKLKKDCKFAGGRVTKKKKPLKRKSRKQNVKKKNRSRKRQPKTRKKRTLRRKALKIVKKRLIIGGNDPDTKAGDGTDVEKFISPETMKEMKKNKYNNEKGSEKYKDMEAKLDKIKGDINKKLGKYQVACTNAAAPAATAEADKATAEADKADKAEAKSTYESDIDKIKEKTIDRYRDEYRNFESNYTKKMYEKEQKFKRNQEDIEKLKTSAEKNKTTEGQDAEEKADAVQDTENNETATISMNNEAIESYKKLQNQELKELQDAHENDKKILQQQHKYDELLLLIDWYEYFLNELHTLMIEHPDIKDDDKKDLVNKKAQYNLNMKNNRTMKESGRNMMNKMSSTVNRIKQLYKQNKAVDGEEDEKEGSKGCCTRTPYHDAVTTFDQVYESCVAMIEGFFGVGDDGGNNPIIEKVKKILISCIQTYLQFHLEKCMEEHIGTLLIVPPEKSTIQKLKEKIGFRGGDINGTNGQETLPEANPLDSLDVIATTKSENYEESNNTDIPTVGSKYDSNKVNNDKPYQENEINKGQHSENPTPTDSNVASEPPKSTTTHAEVIKNQVEKILNNNAIDRCIALHKKIDFKKWI